MNIYDIIIFFISHVFGQVLLIFFKGLNELNEHISRPDL